MECGVKLELRYSNCYAAIQVGPRPEGDTSTLPSIAISTPKKIEASAASASTAQQLDRNEPAPPLNLSTESLYTTPKARAMDESTMFHTPMSTPNIRRVATPHHNEFEEGFYTTPENVRPTRGKKVTCQSCKQMK